MKTIGEKIRMRREQLGLTTRDLAERMGYKNASTISRIESGITDVSQTKVAEFARVMDTTIAYLMGWDDNAIFSEIAVRMRTDAEFGSLVKKLDLLNGEQLASVKQIVDVLLKNV